MSRGKIQFQTYILCSIIISIFFHFNHALGAIINVPITEYQTIQAGIDAAANGDTVLVGDGIYKGEGNKNLDFKGKAIIVISENGPNNTIIDCEDEGRGFWFHSGEGENSVLSGFMITKGQADFGGGIACFNSSPTITNCIITENSANSFTPFDGLGGGIYCDASAPVINNCIISKNSAVQYGGGIGFENGSFPHITDCSIIENSASMAGMGVYSKDSSLNLIHCTIQDNYTNSTAGNGGGIYSYNSNTVITSCVITGHRVGNGGGIYCSGGSLEISDSTISKNEGTNIPNYGGGISCSGTDVNITGCTISQNTAGGGGGIYCDNSIINISQCIITENQSTQFRSDGYGGGGGIFCPNSTGFITNCLIIKNSATLGGGISSDGTSPNITNCSISQNSANGPSGGIYIRNSSPTITNCIFWANSAGEIFVVGGSPIVKYSTIQNGWSGEGNISYNPEFVDLTNGDYHLADYSPCIGTGTSDGAPAFDIVGNPRPNPHGSNPDMGVYENSRGVRDIPPLDIFGLQVGNVWTYQGTDIEGSYTLESEILLVDQTTFPITTYVVESKRDGVPSGTDWFEKTSNEIKLWAQKDGGDFYKFSEGLDVAWYPMQINDHRYSSGTVPIAGYIFNASMTVDVLAVESVELGFDTFEAYKLRYIFRVWGHGLDESTIFYYWVVPYIGFIKYQDNEVLEELTSFTIGGGIITHETDFDGDGLKDYEELIIYETNLVDSDTDNDGMPDGWEVSYGLDPKSDDASDDFDGDGFSNLFEYRMETDPNDPNSYPSMTMPWIPLLLDD